MKQIIPYMILLTLLAGCRPMGDELLSYGQNDNQAFVKAETSFENEFKAFWLAMNENYGIWDYEEEYGVDWDEVYTTYLPKFQALDDSTRKTKVTNDELQALYQQFMDSLHDGHMMLQIKNIHTNQYIVLSPNTNRVMRERKDQYLNEVKCITDLNAYRLPSMTASYQTKAYDRTSSTDIIIEIIDSTIQRTTRAADAYIAGVDAAGGPNQWNDSIYQDVKNLKAEIQTLSPIITFIPYGQSYYLDEYVNRLNAICMRYELISKQIGVDLRPIDGGLAGDGLHSLCFALFEGNVAYLRIGGFRMSNYLDPEEVSHDSTTMIFAYQQSVQRVWHHWFDTIQVLHKNGTLGGVILDVRNNGGGLLSDYQYALGALLPSGGWGSHTLRVKNGSGRLDFGPLTQFVVSTYPYEHEVINDAPIVVLANSHSVSMAENTTWGVKAQPNGCFIGTRTFGGLSALNPDPQAYSETYSGAFGVENVTPIYGYIPKLICLYPSDKGLRPVEGIGFIPDIEVPIDVNLWQTQRRDNQLEAALDYIHSK